MRGPHPSKLLTPWRALLLAACLLGAQMLGLAHAVAHPAVATSAAGADDAWHAGHDAGSTECRLLDQLLGHADCLPAGAALLPSAPAAGRDACAASTPYRASDDACAYQARAPPAC